MGFLTKSEVIDWMDATLAGGSSLACTVSFFVLETTTEFEAFLVTFFLRVGLGASDSESALDDFAGACTFSARPFVDERVTRVIDSSADVGSEAFRFLGGMLMGEFVLVCSRFVAEAKLGTVLRFEECGGCVVLQRSTEL
jgi:hypothetical protein